MLFSQVLASVRREDSGWTAEVADDWMQGRSVFGGLQGALALRVMRSLVPADVPLRTLQTTFVAPVPAGRVALRAQVLREGKNALHVEARIVQPEQTACVAVGVFGRARPSRIDVTPPTPAAGHRDAPHVRGAPRSFVSFAQHFTMRWLEGDLPFSQSKLHAAAIEVSIRDEGPTTEEHVVAIADAIPPLALSLLDGPAPGSSLTWMLEMLPRDLAPVPLAGWVLHSDLCAAKGGYTNQSVLVVAPDGVPVALSRQNMVVFA